jgi:citrate lyase beta subunit
MPGSNTRALEKGRTLSADALILDLEDAVAPDAKELARRQILEALGAGGGTTISPPWRSLVPTRSCCPKSRAPR